MKFFDEEQIKKYSLLIILILTFVIFIILLFDIFFKKDEKVINDSSFLNIESTNNQDVADEEKNAETNLQSEEDNLEVSYYVDIKGAVKTPGVYLVSRNSIINDVINLAGGLKSTASTKFLNLSKKVSNEMVIYIYTTTEEKNLNITKEQTCLNDSVNISKCEGSTTVEQPNTPSNKMETSKDEKEDNFNDNSFNNSNSDDNPSNNSNQNSKVNLNTATKEELMTLNGIGESKALAIIEYREKNNGFKTIEEIKNVSGIGDVAYEKIKDNITV